jgi:hypothetical protein
VKRNIIFFLDLVVQVLAVMIIMTSLATRQSGGVGLIRPNADYLMVEATYTAALPSEKLVIETDPDAVSAITVRRAGSITLLIAARRYSADDRPEPWKIRLHPQLLGVPADRIDVSTPRTPSAQRFDHRPMKELNDLPCVKGFVEFMQ